MRFPGTSAVGSTLDRIEIIRSLLRWSSELDRNGIHKILRLINDLRDDILLIGGIERFDQQITEMIPFGGGVIKADVHPKTPAQRRQALLDRRFTFEGVFGNNAALLEVLETIEKAAGTDLPILIEGESGVGKELLSKIIHANSRRSEQSFISVNCGAIISTLLESELFGHVKGSFTGAVKDRKGKFEAALNGTILLDEIGEIAQESQVKLLRVMESGEIQRVGSDEVIHVNTRCIAATNRNLYRMVQEGRFREDLYYRMSVITVTLPPLRERRDELDLLIGYFLKEASEKLNRAPIRLTPRLRHFLMNHSYPGNIRELRNIIYRMTCIADAQADLKHLPDAIRPQHITGRHDDRIPADASLEQVRKEAAEAAETEFLKQRLSEAGGNVTALAKMLGMNRSYLHTLLTKNGIRSSAFKAVN